MAVKASKTAHTIFQSSHLTLQHLFLIPVLVLGQMGQYYAIWPTLMGALCPMGICALVIFKNTQCYTTQSSQTDFIIRGHNK